MTEPMSAPTPQELAAQGARCAAHPEVVAYAVCKRCGDFMCGTCSEGGKAAQCRNCRERAGGSAFPFTRERYSLEGLIQYSFERFKGQWLTLCLCALVFLGVIYGVSIVGALLVGPMTLLGPSSGSSTAEVMTATIVLQVSMQLAQLVLQLWLQLGMFAVVFDVLEGRTAQLATLFSRLRKLPAVVGLLLLVYLLLALLAAPVAAAYFVAEPWGRLRGAGIVGLVIAFPAIYVMLGAAFAMLELTYDASAGPISALRRSFRLAQGKRWATLAVGIVSMLVTMAGMLACCVGMIPSVVLGTMVYCSFYLALRTPTPAA